MEATASVNTGQPLSAVFSVINEEESARIHTEHVIVSTPPSDAVTSLAAVRSVEGEHSDPTKTTNTTGIFVHNAIEFCHWILRQDFEEVYADSLDRFREDYYDTLYFYNLGYSNETMFTVSDGGAYPFYPSTIHASNRTIILEDVTELTERISWLVDDELVNPCDCFSVHDQAIEANFPLVLPLSLGSDAAIDWPVVLLDHIARAKTAPPSYSAQRNKRVRVEESNVSALVELDLRSLNFPSPSSSSCSSLVSLGKQLDTTRTYAVAKDESLIYLAMMAGCRSLHRSCYDHLRSVLRDYTRAVLDKVCLAGAPSICTAACIQATLDVPVVGFGGLDGGRGGIKRKIVEFIEDLNDSIFPVSSIKVLTDLVFVMVARLLSRAHTLEWSATSPVTVFEVSVPVKEEAMEENRVCTSSESATMASKKLCTYVAAKDEIEIKHLRRFGQACMFELSNTRIVDEVGIEAAMAHYFCRKSCQSIKDNARENIHAFESFGKMGDESLTHGILIPEYVGMIAFQSHGAILTARGAIALTSILDYVIRDYVISNRYDTSDLPRNDFVCTRKMSHAIVRGGILSCLCADVKFRESDRHADMLRRLFDMPEQLQPYLNSRGCCPFTGFTFLKMPEFTIYYPEIEAISKKTRQERRVAAMRMLDVHTYDKVISSTLQTYDDLSVKEVDISVYSDMVELCQQVVAENTLLCIDRECLQHIIDEYLGDQDLDQDDIRFTHEALNVLQTAVEGHLLALLELANHRSKGIVYAEDIDAATVDLLLWRVCLQGDVVSARTLVESGANVNCKYFSASPITLAAQLGNIELAKLLVEAGAKFGKAEALDGPFLAALAFDHADFVRYLVSRGGNMLAEIVESKFILLELLRSSNLEMLELLYQQDIDINRRYNHNNTALHVACGEWPPNMDAVEFLIFSGSDTSLRNGNENTAFELLRSESDKERFQAAIETRDNPGLK